MKKTAIFLPILLAALLFAAGGFWQTLMDIEKKFYQQTQVQPAEKKENIHSPLEQKKKEGATASAAPSKKESNATSLKVQADLSSLIDARLARFNELIALLKEKPYEVRDPKNPFFNPKKAQSLRAKLKTRIAANTKYGYKFAVTRDRIALDVLFVKERIYRFFVYLADSWTEMDVDTLRKRIAKEKSRLKQIDIDSYKTKYDAALSGNDKISKAIVENFRELSMHRDFFNDILDYLDANPALLRYRSLASLFNLDQLIEKINSVPSFAQINVALRYLHLDMGRLSIFLLIMLLAWGSSFVIYYKVYAVLKHLIMKEENEIDELLLYNLEKLRRPLFLLILTFGFELGIEVLIYPKPLDEAVLLLFYAVYLLIISYILILVVDSIFFEYLLKKEKAKTKEVRQELINLILSIVKITIVIVALIMLLVRMGVNITGLLASLGIGGLAVALAAQSTLSNFFGLLKIIFDNSFSQGDWIETKDVEGTVVEIGFISTVIRTFDNALIVVPNATLANSALKNWNRRTIGRRIKMYVGVTYGSRRENLMTAIDEIHTMLIDHPDIATPKNVDKKIVKKRSMREKKLVSIEDKYGIKSTLLVYLDEFADSSVNILIYCFSKTVNWEEWLKVKQDVMLKIWEILERNDLEFAFPSESIYFDPENVKSTFHALPKWE
ncbi:mechanosensitive ion channel family protein [Hydrogenimonas sp.]